MNIIQFINKDRKESNKAREEFTRIALENGFNVYDKNKNEEPAIIMPIGGDGTFLNAVHVTGFLKDAYYIGYNTGHVGFLQNSNVTEDDFIKLLNCISNGKNEIENEFKITQMYLLDIQIKIERNGETLHINDKALNDIIMSSKTRRTFKADLYLNDEKLEEFSGDSILISSPTGSTAYCMNAGGAIITEELPIMEIIPMQAVRGNYSKNLINPLITSKLIKIIPKVPCYVQIDGMENDNIKQCEIKEIKIFIAEQKIKRVHINNSSNKITTIKKKFLE